MVRSKPPARNVKLKRAYDDPAAADGMRVLVDRLWPRGVKKEAAAIDLWAKDLAPSTELRKWFGHDPTRWAEFERRYTTEVLQHAELLDKIRKLARRGTVSARPRAQRGGDHPRYAGWLRGAVRCLVHLVERRRGTWRIITFVAALRRHGMRVAQTNDGALTRKKFLAYVQH